MCDIRRCAAVGLILLLACAPVRAADPSKPEWTPEVLKAESAACTDELVKGAWENTKRDQQLDPGLEMTPEMRKQFAPQIATMAAVCDCAVREAAKKFGRGDVDKPEFKRFAIETVTTGKCKPKP
jgi:hypothetical protein